MATPGDGFYSSTSGTYFPDKQSLTEHYQSDLHRYNLKRKIAGLPPVTKDWFEARKEQLTQSGSVGDVHKVYYDPLTRKKFNSKNAYMTAINSRKYKDLVAKSGKPAPSPTIYNSNKQPAAKSGSKEAAAPQQPSQGYVATPNPLHRANAGQQAVPDSIRQEVEEISEDESDWDTASDDDAEAAEAAALAAEGAASDTSTQSAAPASDVVADREAPGVEPENWEEWDVRRSLFDNHTSPSFEANLDYMFKHFGFYFPDAEYLKDPEGLLKYLGAKLQYGHVPLSTRGDDDKARQFASLHAVQRHMVDRNNCKMVYDDNEEEYEDFYDYTALDEDPEGKELAMVDGGPEADVQLGTADMELVLPAAGSNASRRVLGNRSFALYYRQRHRAADTRQSVAVNTVLAKYRALSIATHTPTVSEPQKKAQRAKRRYDKAVMAAAIKDTENRTRLQAQGPGPFHR